MKKITLFMITIFLSVIICGNIQAAGPGDVSIGGFVSQGYLKTSKNNYLTDTEDGSFQFNEMGLNFRTFPSDKLSIGCQIFSRDLGEVGNDEVTINWAFAEYSWREWMGVRAGLVKIPFGFYHDTRDVDTLRTNILLPSSVYNEWFRDGINSLKGVELYGNINLASAGTLKYQLQTGEMQIPLDSGTTRFIKEVNGVHDVTDIDVNKIYASKLEWITPLEGLRLGTTLMKTDLTQEWKLVTDSGNDTTFDNKDIKFYVYSAEYTRGNLVVAAEKYMLKREADMVMHLDATFAPIITRNPAAPAGDYTVDKDMDSDASYYVSASYRFLDWLEMGVYYSFFENDKDGSGAANELKDTCLSARFDINDNWTAKIEAHKMDGLFGVEAEEDGTLDEDWYLYAAKMTFSF